MQTEFKQIDNNKEEKPFEFYLEKYEKLELAVAEPTNISIDGEISQFIYLKAEMVKAAFRFIVPKGLEVEK